MSFWDTECMQQVRLKSTTTHNNISTIPISFVSRLFAFYHLIPLPSYTAKTTGLASCATGLMDMQGSDLVPSPMSYPPTNTTMTSNSTMTSNNMMTNMTMMTAVSLSGKNDATLLLNLIYHSLHSFSSSHFPPLPPSHHKTLISHQQHPFIPPTCPHRRWSQCHDSLHPPQLFQSTGVCRWNSAVHVRYD